MFPYEVPLNSSLDKFAVQNQGHAKAGSVRFLNLHEYQSKDLLESYGVSVQKGKVARSADEAFKVAQWIKDESKLALII